MNSSCVNSETSLFTSIWGTCVHQAHQSERFQCPMPTHWQLFSTSFPVQIMLMSSVHGCHFQSWHNACRLIFLQPPACTKWQCGRSASIAIIRKNSKITQRNAKLSFRSCSKMDFDISTRGLSVIFSFLLLIETLIRGDYNLTYRLTGEVKIEMSETYAERDKNWKLFS